jgi:hypothetical protein
VTLPSDEAFELLCLLSVAPNWKRDTDLIEELGVARKRITELLAEIRNGLKVRVRVKWYYQRRDSKTQTQYRNIAISENYWQEAQDYANQYWAWKYENGPPIELPQPKERHSHRNPLSADQQAAIEDSIRKSVDEDITRSDEALAAIVYRDLDIQIHRSSLAHYRRRLGIPSSRTRMAKAGMI